LAYWWVNHKQTRDHEVRGDYLWSPRRNQNGARNQSYDNMALAQPGDVVYSYANGVLGAVGIVIARASPCPKPTEFGSVGDYWSNEGWLLPVAFTELERAVRPKDHIGLIAPLLPNRYSPIRRNGDGNQGVYLAAIPIVLGVMLDSLSGHAPPKDIQVAEAPSLVQLADVRDIEGDGSIPETQRAQLVQARVGQGLFRSRVLMKEQCCRVTGVRDHRLLRASHIKPWRHASNEERLSADNGLMLAPHVDAMFDQELISFEDSGRMIVRRDLSLEVLSRWAIDPKADVGPFRAGQRPFLEAHREALRNRWRA